MITLADPQNPVPADVLTYVNGALGPIALVAALDLDLFTPLASGALTLDELAGRLGVAPAKLQLLVDTLVTTGALTSDDGRLANTLVADRLLVRDRSGSVRGRHMNWHDVLQSSLSTAATLRTSVPQSKHDFLDMSVEDLRHFLRAMAPGTAATGESLLKAVDLSQVQHVLDAGGGVGALALALTQRLPHLRATVLDFPQVAELACEYLAETAGSERIAAVAGDLLEPLPVEGFDAVVLRAVLQTMSEDQCQRALHNVAAAMRPGGLLVISGWVLDDDRRQPAQAVNMNLVFLNVYDGGQSYTEAEHRVWLTAAGFTNIQRQTQADGQGLITALRT